MKTTLRLLVVFSVALVPAFAVQSTPLRIEQTVEPQFPAALSLTTITRGEARVVINVDADGKLTDLMVTGYTDKAFADEAVTMLRRWRYTAATENGEPIGIRTELRFNFEAQGRVVSLMAIETQEVLFRQITQQTLITPVCHPNDLDHPIAAVNPASPRNPGKASSGRARTVLVDFYVDEKGQPRMPVVINSAQEAFAQAAVGALNQWRFTTPTRDGKPVSVRVRQEFIFPGSS